MDNKTITQLANKVDERRDLIEADGMLSDNEGTHVVKEDFLVHRLAKMYEIDSNLIYQRYQDRHDPNALTVRVSALLNTYNSKGAEIFFRRYRNSVLHHNGPTLDTLLARAIGRQETQAPPLPKPDRSLASLLEYPIIGPEITKIIKQLATSPLLDNGVEHALKRVEFDLSMFVQFLLNIPKEDWEGSAILKSLGTRREGSSWRRYLKNILWQPIRHHIGEAAFDLRKKWKDESLAQDLVADTIALKQFDRVTTRAQDQRVTEFVNVMRTVRRSQISFCHTYLRLKPLRRLQKFSLKLDLLRQAMEEEDNTAERVLDAFLHHFRPLAQQIQKSTPPPATSRTTVKKSYWRLNPRPVPPSGDIAEPSLTDTFPHESSSSLPTGDLLDSVCRLFETTCQELLNKEVDAVYHLVNTCGMDYDQLGIELPDDSPSTIFHGQRWHGLYNTINIFDIMQERESQAIVNHIISKDFGFTFRELFVLLVAATIKCSKPAIFPPIWDSILDQVLRDTLEMTPPEDEQRITAIIQALRVLTHSTLLYTCFWSSAGVLAVSGQTAKVDCEKSYSFLINLQEELCDVEGCSRKLSYNRNRASAHLISLRNNLKMDGTRFGAQELGIPRYRLRGLCPVNLLTQLSYDPASLLVIHYASGLCHYTCKVGALKEGVVTARMPLDLDDHKTESDSHNTDQNSADKNVNWSEDDSEIESWSDDGFCQ